MTQTSFPFENIDTTETQFSQWARNIGEGFVADDNGDRLEVEPGTSLSVDVAPGRALVRGHYYTSTAVESLGLAVADTDNPRLDTVVLRLDPTANSIVLAVVTGTPSDPPAKPAIVQTDAGVYELPVADVLVPANSGVPTTITDRRDFVVNTSADGLFYKTDSNAVAFTDTMFGSSVIIKAGTKLEVEGKLIKFVTSTPVTMPTLTPGTDYFIYVDDNGSAQAVEAMGSHPTPVASEPANSRLIGGFHFAPGGNATGQAGGNTTPAINEYSFWDLKWRPIVVDPRGMTLVANMFWADIYLLNRDPDTFGTSRNNQPIADGQTASTTTAIIPAAFGGNGSTRYAGQTWWNTAEALSAYGKRLPRYREHAAFAYGTTEANSRGNDPVTTGFGTTTTGSSNTDEKFTSKWGVVQSSGVMRVWGDEFGGGNAAGSMAAITDGRGSVFQQENVAVLGGGFDDGVDAGSRAAYWNFSPSVSFSRFGGRGVCDHLTVV